MAVTSQRTGNITFTGDVTATVSLAAVSNTQAPGAISILSLSTGANTITLPTGGSTPIGAVIIPVVGNTQSLTLKGVSGDTGIALHKTNPTIITFDNPAPANFVLTAGGVINGLRIVWT